MTEFRVWEDPINVATAHCALRPHSQDEVVFREVWGENVYRLRRRDVEGRVVVDVGANVGAFSIWAALLGAVHVDAYEPEPGNLAALEQNVGLSEVRHAVTPIGAAVGERAGIGALVRPSDVDETGGWQVASLPGQYGDDGPEVVVHGIRAVLERAAEGNHPVVMKLDVEGGEYEIFRGLDEEILAPVERIVAEFHVGPLGELVEVLSEWGHVETMGRASVGGMIYARRYGVDE